MQHLSRTLSNILQHPQLRSLTPNRGLVTPIALRRYVRFLAHVMSSYGVLIGSTSLLVRCRYSLTEGSMES
jgi:hypothetical protein